MTTISSVTFGNTQTNPTITITGTGFGAAPQGMASAPASNGTGLNYGTSLFVSDLTRNFSAGLSDGVTTNAVGLTNLSYSDSSITFQMGSVYSLYLYAFKAGDNAGVSVNGASFFAPVSYNSPITTATIGVARFFDTNNGTHFFTADPNEVQQVLATRPDLVEESGGFNAIDPASTGPTAAPVYRFFDSTYGTHFFTSSATEKNDASASRADLKYEGIAFYEDATQQTGDVAVYRYFDTHFGTHFYSSSATENSTILATRPDLKPEGIAFYAPT